VGEEELSQDDLDAWLEESIKEAKEALPDSIYAACLRHYVDERPHDWGTVGPILEWLTEMGHTVALIFDDNGHWALVTEGFQMLPMSEEAQDLATTFWVLKRDWYDDPLTAIIEGARRALGEEEKAP